MRILVTGAEGQLGRSIRQAAIGLADDYIFTDVEELDITDHQQALNYVTENKIDIIINCAAYTDVERAESEEPKAHLLNATAVGYLAEAAKANDALLIHISTDYVFMGGCCGVLTEESHPQPINAYGRTKLAGEEAIKASGCHYIIIRTAWLYSEFGKNFCKTMMNLTATRPQLKVVFDQVGTPTYALDLAKAITLVIEKFDGTQIGVYHYSNEGVCSWFDFTKIIAEYNGTTECDVQPCHSDEFPSPVKRPAYSVLDKTKIKDVFGVKVPYWTESLKQCINNLKNQ